jgi:hypothetical protein
LPVPVAGSRARSIRPGVLTTLAAAAAVLSAVLLTGASSQAMTRPRPGSTGVADGTWGRAQAVPEAAALADHHAWFTQLSCSSPGNCAGGGNYNTDADRVSPAFVVTEVHGTWQQAQPVPGLAALDHERNGAWGTAEQVPGILALDKGGNADLGQLSCSSPEHCTAVGWFNGGTVKQPSWGLYAVSEPAGPGLADHRLHQASRALTSITSSSPSERRRQGES